MRCKNCHYSLENLTENRCPECGTAFDPNDPTTFYWSAIAARRRDLGIYILIQCAFGVLLLAVIHIWDTYLAAGWKLELAELGVPLLVLATLIGPVLLTRLISKHWHRQSP